MTDTFAPASRAIIITAALVIIIAGMKQAAPLLVPFLLSIFIAVISFPLMSRLQQSGISKGLSLTVVMLLVISIGIGLTLLVGSSLTDFSRSLPDYQQKITAEWGQVIVWLQDHGISVADKLRAIADPAAAMGLISSILKGFGNVLTNSFLIILMVVFLLMEAAGVTQKFLLMREQVEDEESDKDDFSQVFVDKLREYMSMKTIISIITGVIIWLAMWLIGLDFPVLWGVLAFMLNFVPNIGSIIAAVPAVMLALVQLGFSSALLVMTVYIAVNVLIGSVIEPRYMGKGLGLSTLVVFVSLVFWGWVLGSVGMLLSVPLTITVKLALDCKPETQWLGHLLGHCDE
ncbi:MAG: AI-2E family transporter [Gammaproteobacteria bacterium]|nr:AI-2E family transporter [Gammaproteobacteria bacterium]MBT8133928.1 AI-2E family transporter [Gammaproteobacteria bacterium]NNJ49104.1 AI-2E family transporter [Gammaproteobacteria bacterium]